MWPGNIGRLRNEQETFDWLESHAGHDRTIESMKQRSMLTSTLRTKVTQPEKARAKNLELESSVRYCVNSLIHKVHQEITWKVLSH